MGILIIKKKNLKVVKETLHWKFLKTKGVGEGIADGVGVGVMVGVGLGV